MELTITARTVNVVLNTVRDLSGHQYDCLLERAGWLRFRAAIPDESAQLVATRAELESLFTNVYTLLGEDLMRLFLRNYGRHLVAYIPVAGLQVAAAAIPPEQQLAWFVTEIAQVSTRYWTPTVITEDAQTYYLTFERCPLCVGVQGAHTPICATMDTFYRPLAQQAIQRRLRVVEVACAAMGASHCKIAIYKED